MGGRLFWCACRCYGKWGAVLCRSETEIRGRVEGSGGKRVFQKRAGDLRGVVVRGKGGSVWLGLSWRGWEQV